MSTHKNLPAALIAAQQAFTPVVKDNRANTGKYSYSYADLGSVLEAVTPGLHANGLVISQCMDLYDSQPCIKTILMHADSEKELVSYTPIIWADKSDPQKFGGGITYSRRYALMAMLNLGAEDDDGQHARKPAEDRSREIVSKPEPQPERDITPPTIDREITTTRNGSLSKSEEAKEKTTQMNKMFALANKLGLSDDELKDGLRQTYRPATPEAEFSRKDLSLDELILVNEKLQKRVDKMKMELSKA